MLDKSKIGEKAIKAVKKIIQSYLVLDCFEAGITVEYKDLLFERLT